MRELGDSELTRIHGGDKLTSLCQCISIGAVLGGVSGLFLADNWVEDDLLNLAIDYLGISAGIVVGAYGGLCVFNYLF